VHHSYQVPTLCYLQTVRDQCTIATRYLSGRRSVHHSHEVLWSIFRQSGTSAPLPQGIYLAEDRCTIPTRYFGLSIDGQGSVHHHHKVLIWPKTGATAPTMYCTLVYLVDNIETVRDQFTVTDRSLCWFGHGHMASDQCIVA
jgi:hypothetical protein